MSFLGSRSIVFLGTPEPAARVLGDLVSAGFPVSSVVTRADVRRGRGSTASPSPVKRVAMELGVAVQHDPAGLAGSAQGSLLGVVVAYGRIISPRILSVVPMVNVHFSLLPRWRGAAPIERAILAGDETTGVCLMDVVDELDAGGVFARGEIRIGESNTDELTERLTELGSQMLIDLLSGDLVVPAEQQGEITYAEKISAGEGRIEWSDDAGAVLRRIRALRAHTTVEGRRMIVHSALAVDRGTHGAARPGDCDGSATVVCGSGAVQLVEVQPEGKGTMDAREWRRGRREAVVALGS